MNNINTSHSIATCEYEVVLADKLERLNQTFAKHVASLSVWWHNSLLSVQMKLYGLLFIEAINKRP